MDITSQSMIIIAFLLILGSFAEYIFSRTGLPDVVWLVGAGILIGPVLRIVDPGVLQPAVPLFGAVSLSVILAGGAFRLQISDVLAAAPRGLLLGLLGFVMSMLGLFIYIWTVTELGLMRQTPPVAWLMMGAIVGGTSALIIMPSVATGGVDERVARTLEVESATTDALSVVVTMLLIDLILEGTAGIMRPVSILVQQLVIGVGIGVVSAAVIVPAIPSFRSRSHGFTLFLALMMALYGLTNHLGGNGAMAVLACALLVGNAASLVPRLIPGAKPEVFASTEVSSIVQEQMTFLIKSFFFVLIGLMFPTDLRLICLGIAGAFFVALWRIPAVAMSMRGRKITRKQFWLLVVAIPRGLAAGVLSTMPMQMGVPDTENLSGAIFAFIVASITIFAFGFAALNSKKDEPVP